MSVLIFWLESIMAGWKWFVTGTFTAFVAYCNLPPAWIRPAERATLAWLSSAKLTPLGGSFSGSPITADTLFKDKGALVMAVRRPGCLLCRDEAINLSKLHSDLAKSLGNKNVPPLIGILHEELGHEEFAKYFTGPLYLDPAKKFFGPTERRILVTGFLNVPFWFRVWDVKSREVPGNLDGDGTLLGGVFVVGPGEQGVVFESREEYWGDHVNMTQLEQAVRKISKSK